jgi:hypothetical protein
MPLPVSANKQMMWWVWKLTGAGSQHTGVIPLSAYGVGPSSHACNIMHHTPRRSRGPQTKLRWEKGA